MTMSSTFTRDPKPRIQYTADGTRTVFAFPFTVEAIDDLLVYEGDQVATGFAIDGLGDDAGGEILFAEAPAAGTVLTLVRRSESIRETAFVDGGPFRAAAINAELDRIMMLIQEDRDAHGRAIRVGAPEPAADLCLPVPSARANRVLGFDSAGAPAVFGTAELPVSGDASGASVTAAGGTTARSLGEHLGAWVDVRDFGAIGDGVTDDSGAFAAAIAAAALRRATVYVPAGPLPYLLASGLTLTAVRMIGDGAGSTLKLAPASGFGLQLGGSGARLAALRLVGPGASAWPGSASEVDLTGISLAAVEIASGALRAALVDVDIAAAGTGIAVRGGLTAIAGCDIAFCGNGIELRAGTTSPLHALRSTIRQCAIGIRADGAATSPAVSVDGGRIVGCGFGLDLSATPAKWRSVRLGGVTFRENLDADLRASARHAVTIDGGSSDATGRRQKAQVRLVAGGATTEAPGLTVTGMAAAVTERATVTLSGGSNLNLLAAGDLIVLAGDPDRLNDFWTASKATRAGIVHGVVSQSATTATIRVARAGKVVMIQASDQIRIVGRSGTAAVDSVGSLAAATTPKWINADDHCRIVAIGNPLIASGITLAGTNARLDILPGRGGETAKIGNVTLDKGQVNGGFVRLLSFEIGQDTAISFTPDSTRGMVQAFAQSLATGDPVAAVFSYRADALGYTQLVARGMDNAGATDSAVKVKQRVALTGTSGSVGEFTYSAHTDGKIYVENRLAGPPVKVSLFVVGAPLI